MKIQAGQIDLRSLEPSTSYTVICNDSRMWIESTSGVVEMNLKAHGGLMRIENGWLDLHTLTPGTTYGLHGGEKWKVWIISDLSRANSRDAAWLRRFTRPRRGGQARRIA